MTKAALDPITIEVIRHGLVSITDQIDANITRTAFSPYVYEYKDFAVGLVSAFTTATSSCAITPRCKASTSTTR
jgi:N-methylhydantoinase B/oxoprolinase/acetone carboxylase alpha subunit